MSDDITTAITPDDEGPKTRVVCAVVHYDNQSNEIPCPGYPHKPAEPLSQPECAVCHQFGPGVVQDAIQSLRMAVEAGWLEHAEATEDASIVLTALERHHQHS